MKGAYGEGNGSVPPKPWAEEGRSRWMESMDDLAEERGGRGSGLPGWERKGKLKEDGGGRRMKIGWLGSLEASWMSWKDGRLRNLLWLAGLCKGGSWGRDMEGGVGERSRSDSDFSELGENAVGDQGARRADVMKLGRGGAREAESSAEDSYKWQTSSLEVDTRVRSSALVCWRSLDIVRGERREEEEEEDRRACEQGR